MTVKRVSPLEAAALLEDEGYAYLDVRSIPEFDGGHAVGAYNIPLMHATPSGMRPNGDFISVVAAAFPKASKLVVGCRSGNRSLRAAEALLAAGYEHVVDQRAGHEGVRDAFGQLEEPGWHAAGLEVEHEAEPERSYEALLTRRDR
ncbi:MAG: rhodanese-like domain-containing protein [Myxococcales bacterium]|nr:rhodanese-like domain-containing protein [Deltaproteobacteria bacterium]NNE20374.1 rhodanese-like domain-containing protein [Myxococcales bacterium]